jgi:hypothetical protein
VVLHDLKDDPQKNDRSVVLRVVLVARHALCAVLTGVEQVLMLVLARVLMNSYECNYLFNRY